MTTSSVPAEVLAGMDPDDFDALVRASLGRDANPAVWDALTDPAVINRTRTVLSGIHVDVQNQLSLANADLSQARHDGYAQGPDGRQAYFAAQAAQAEWRRKAAGFRRIVEQRIALVKSRTPRSANQPTGTGGTGKINHAALEQLARAVTAHRDKILSGQGGEDDDENLWGCLDRITAATVSGGEMPLSKWLSHLEDLRDEDQ